MKKTQQKFLTETNLISELEKAGFNEISKRTISEWRRNGLLPEFDEKGRGLGKGLGRTESSWINSSSIVERAIWICRMRIQGIGLGDIRLNLWMLGFEISIEDVREYLLDPLVWHIEKLEAEDKEFQETCDRSLNTREDVINEIVSKAISKLPDSPLNSLGVPEGLFEAMANVFLNPKYDLYDYSFSESFDELEKWQINAQKVTSKVFEDYPPQVSDVEKHTEIFSDFLNNAEFIQQYLSLHPVEKAVRECSDEDLIEVQKDMMIIAKIVMTITNAVQKLMKHFPSKFDDDSSEDDQILPLLFYVAELIVLADISLRRNGYSQLINGSREQLLHKIQTEFNETVCDGLERFAPDISQAMTQTFEIMESKLQVLMEKSSEFQTVN